MAHWEGIGKSDEWYTPKYIFDALGVEFDMDVAHPADVKTWVPAKTFISFKSLERTWVGFIWMNPPFGGRNGLTPWVLKFIEHGDGIALVPDRTSAPWFQWTAHRSHAVLFMSPKVKFQAPSGELGKSPSTGTALFAVGQNGVGALRRASRLGWFIDLLAAQGQQQGGEDD
jgi:hypothetical protein